MLAQTRRPFRELDDLERRLRRLADEAAARLAPVPPTDVYESDDELVLEVDVPGFDERQLKVEVVDGTLVVRGAHEEQPARPRRLVVHERQGRFVRRYDLPAGCDARRVRASCSRGLLTVRVPRAAVPPGRVVPIAFEQAAPAPVETTPLGAGYDSGPVLDHEP